MVRILSATFFISFLISSAFADTLKIGAAMSYQCVPVGCIAGEGEFVYFFRNFVVLKVSNKYFVLEEDEKASKGFFIEKPAWKFAAELNSQEEVKNFLNQQKLIPYSFELQPEDRTVTDLFEIDLKVRANSEEELIQNIRNGSIDFNPRMAVRKAMWIGYGTYWSACAGIIAGLGYFFYSTTN